MTDDLASAINGVLVSVPTVEHVKAVERGIREGSIPGLQEIDELPVKHHFADGLYARELFRPAGTVIVGKMHAKRNFYLLTSGEVTVWTESGMKRVTAPYLIVTQPGTKRISYAHTDATVITFHATAETDLDKIEAEHIIPDVSELEAETRVALEHTI